MMDLDARDLDEKRRTLREAGIVVAALFTSSGTLVCCALPIMLVSIAGLGAVVASVTSSFPILVTLGAYKEAVFAISGVMLAVSAWTVFRPGRTCPADPDLARWCTTFQTWNRRMVITSMLIWTIGFFAAFLALPLRIAFDL